MTLEELENELERRIKEIEAAIKEIEAAVVVTKKEKHDTLAAEAVEYLRGAASAYRSSLGELKKIQWAFAEWSR